MDELIKRRTGQLSDDQDYSDWRSDRCYGGRAGAWDLSDEEIEKMERQAEQAAREAGHEPGHLRADLEAIAEGASKAAR